jgi:Right handed beta helix region
MSCRALVFAVLVLARPALASAQPVVNISRDLVSLGIASQNAAPNVPTLDTRPLLDAAVAYAQSHHVPRITADQGAYYFLTTPYADRYLNLYRISDLTIDLAGSTIYFQEGLRLGIALTECQRVTLANFKTDFINPPYTQVQLTGVDTANGGRLLYSTLPGWPHPTTTFTTPSFDLFALAFRNGAIVPGTSRIGFSYPVASQAIAVRQEGTPGAPWTQPDYLAAHLRPGDTIALTQRGNGNPIQVFRSDAVTLSSVTVQGASSFAVMFDGTSNSIADHVRVQPRPGGLIGSNIDGIHFSSARENNHIRHCFVTHTVDDAFIFDSQYIATVVARTGPRQLRVRRSFYLRFPNGTPVNFVDAVSTREIVAGAIIVSQNPPDAYTFNAEIDLVFDRDLPALAPGDGMVFGAAAQRGAGSSIEDSEVGEVPFGRGIWISGVMGVAVRRNTIGPTSNGGIVVSSDTAVFHGPPAHDIVIEDNVLTGSLGPAASGTGSQLAVAAIIVESLDHHFNFATTAYNTNITIRGNRITGSGRAGIFVGELDGGVIENNQISDWNQHPELPYWGVSSAVEQQMRADAQQALVVRHSANVAIGANPTPAQYLAEGATGSFFETRMALFNPSPTAVAVVHVTFQTEAGASVPHVVTVPPYGRRTIDVASIPALASASFSTRIEPSTRLIVDRTMTWDHAGYGSHAETAVPSPATTWYLAEGSTSADFALYYLLQNPNPFAVSAVVRYLRPFGQPPIEKSYSLAASSRTTIPVDNQGPELASTDVSAVITAGAPIIAERAMYKSSSAQIYAAGHESAGVTAPATRWFLAEGATGGFFDLFILLANPTATPAEVRVDYLLSAGGTHTRTYLVPANGRFTIWVDDEQIPAGSGQRPLAAVAVSSIITSTNDVPIIVERTMWWPGPGAAFPFWTEAHNSPGATVTGTTWALAEGETGGARNAETYILIANTSAFGGQARVRLYAEDGTSVERTVTLAPNSRTTLSASGDFPAIAGKRFGALIESLGATPAQIVVERAMYTSPNGQFWAAGTNALGTRLP